jgi:hypothetical protein
MWLISRKRTEVLGTTMWYEVWQIENKTTLKELFHIYAAIIITEYQTSGLMICSF